MKTSQKNVMPYNDVKIGQLFRALEDDIVRGKVVNNTSIYAKVGHTVAADVGNGSNKDCCFDLQMPCRVIEHSSNFSVKRLVSYRLCTKGEANARA